MKTFLKTTALIFAFVGIAEGQQVDPNAEVWKEFDKNTISACTAQVKKKNPASTFEAYLDFETNPATSVRGGSSPDSHFVPRWSRA